MGEQHEVPDSNPIAQQPNSLQSKSLRHFPLMTLFEKIAAREIPADIIAEGEEWIAFRDISPQAPVHFLIVPKRCIPRINEATPSNSNLLGILLSAAAETACREGLGENGYRIVINNGPDGGETVPHLHLHVLGGREMNWPPG